MKIGATIVSIEITRKCNLSCAHCMRGEAQNISFDITMLEQFFDEVKLSNVLCISGGEPFLCYDEIKQLVHLIKQKGFTTKKVLIVTNATIYDERIYKLLEENFENFEVDISFDSYHLNSIHKRYNTKDKSNNPRLNPCSIEEISKNVQLHITNPHFGRFYSHEDYIINIGRAKYVDSQNKLPLLPRGYFYTDCVEDILLVGPEIYIDVEGNITEGNTSYEDSNKYSIGNIKDNKISEILLKNAIKYDCLTHHEFSKFIDEKWDVYKDYMAETSAKKN